MVAPSGVFQIFLFVIVGIGVAASSKFELFGFGNTNTNSYKCNAIGRTVKCPSLPQSCALCHALPVLVDEIASVCSGEAHTVVLMNNGSVYGSGARYLLGLGASSTDCNDDFLEKISLPQNTVALEIACGLNSSVILANGSTLVVFGDNGRGIFGNLPAGAFVGTPLVITAQELGIESPTTIQGVKIGLDTIVLHLSNGSLATLGSGVLRGSSMAYQNSQAPNFQRNVSLIAGALEGCHVTHIAVGLRHALVKCNNGSVIGFGDNAFYQLINTTTATYFDPVLLEDFPSTDVSEFSLGTTHSLALLGNGTVFVRGDNSAGQLGLGPLVTTAFQWSPIENLTFQQLSAGNGYTLFLSKGVVAAPTWGMTNVFAAGSNGACALGLATAETLLAATYTLSPVPIAPRSTVRGVLVYASMHKRSFLLANDTRTESQTQDLSITSSFAVTESNETTTKTGTFSQTSISSSRILSHSVTLEATRTPPPTRSKTKSKTKIRTNTVTESVEESFSVTMAKPPYLQKVTFNERFCVLHVYFDSSTNQAGSASKYVSVGREIDKLFVISGHLQSFGETYNGEWFTDSEFLLRPDKLYSNITIGVARFSVAENSKILNVKETSLPSPQIFQLVQLEVVQDYGVAITVKHGFASWVQPTLIVCSCCVGVATIAFFGLWILNNNRVARESMDEKIEMYKRERETVVIEEITTERRIKYLGQPASNMVTFSSVRTGEKYDQRPMAQLQSVDPDSTAPYGSSGKLDTEVGEHLTSGALISLPPPAKRSELPQYSFVSESFLQSKAAAEREEQLQWRFVERNPVAERTQDEIVREPFGGGQELEITEDTVRSVFFDSFRAPNSPVPSRAPRQPRVNN